MLSITCYIVGEDYPETLKKVRYSSMSWMHDNKGFFYGVTNMFLCMNWKYISGILKGYLNQTGKADGSETTSSENQKLYYHILGTDQSEDIEVVEFEDKEIRM